MTPDIIAKALAEAAPLAMAVTDHKAKGFHLDVSLSPDALVKAVSILDANKFFIETITGVDWLGENEARFKEAQAAAAKAAKAKAAEAKGERGEAPAPAEPAPEPAKPGPDDLEAVYDFNHYAALCRVTLRVRTPRDNPVIPTISQIYQAAHWHEREAREFFGFTFAGHPYPVPLLLPEDADFHPLRKDFKP